MKRVLFKKKKNKTWRRGGGTVFKKCQCQKKKKKTKGQGACSRFEAAEDTRHLSCVSDPKTEPVLEGENL